MTGQPAGQSSLGRITEGIAKDKLILDTIAWVRRQLSDWRDDPDRPDEQTEPKLNPQLCKFLEKRARSTFFMVLFTHEEPQSGHAHVDLSASPASGTMIGSKYYSSFDSFLIFECKRLPLPTRKREMEYVTGGIEKSGGIQRIKLGIHGAELDTVVMIGYIQERSSKYWYKTLNTWISKLAAGAIPDCCTWDDSEKLADLNEDISEGIAECRSLHSRSSDDTKVSIYHLWIAMSKRKSQRVTSACLLYTSPSPRDCS